jgi:Bacterial regulatory helix-turn-helix proteins, AraC family
MMLARSNLTITEVAGACGFADPLYFSRRFRAAHGIAPSAYRDNGAAAVPPDLPGLPSLAAAWQRNSDYSVSSRSARARVSASPARPTSRPFSRVTKPAGSSIGAPRVSTDWW